MKRNILLLAIFSLLSSLLPAQSRTERWSVKEANDWYNKQPWFCGFNYIPAYAINYTAMWDKSSFDPVAIDRELSLAESVGLNCLRAVLQYAVYADDPAYFLKTIDTFLAICDKHHIKFMPALFDDCVFGLAFDPVIGKQPEPLIGWYAWAWSPSPGHSMVVDSTTHPLLEKYVKDVLGAFRHDERVFVWDLYNEPTNGGLGTATLPLLKKVVQWAWEINPDQPLTIDIWNNNKRLNDIAVEGSDIISFHNYGNKTDLERHIADLKQYGRPMINTEWMNRPNGSTIKDNLAVFFDNKIGCMFWGLVNGKTQTNLPWGHRPGDPEPTVWQHDLFKQDYQPYDPSEVETLRKTIAASQSAVYKKQNTLKQ